MHPTNNYNDEILCISKLHTVKTRKWKHFPNCCNGTGYKQPNQGHNCIPNGSMKIHLAGALETFADADHRKVIWSIIFQKLLTFLHFQKVEWRCFQREGTRTKLWITRWQSVGRDVASSVEQRLNQEQSLKLNLTRVQCNSFHCCDYNWESFKWKFIRLCKTMKILWNSNSNRSKVY